MTSPKFPTKLHFPRWEDHLPMLPASGRTVVGPYTRGGNGSGGRLRPWRATQFGNTGNPHIWRFNQNQAPMVHERRKMDSRFFLNVFFQKNWCFWLSSWNARSKNSEMIFGEFLFMGFSKICERWDERWIVVFFKCFFPEKLVLLVVILKCKVQKFRDDFLWIPFYGLFKNLWTVCVFLLSRSVVSSLNDLVDQVHLVDQVPFWSWSGNLFVQLPKMMMMMMLIPTTRWWHGIDWTLDAVKKKGSIDIWYMFHVWDLRHNIELFQRPWKNLDALYIWIYWEQVLPSKIGP